MFLYLSEVVKGLSRRVVLSNVLSMTFITDTAGALADNIDSTYKTAQFPTTFERN